MLRLRHFVRVCCLLAIVALAGCGDSHDSPPAATPSATALPTLTATHAAPTPTSAAPTSTLAPAPTATGTTAPSATPTASASSVPTATATESPTSVPTRPLRVGVAAVSLKPCGTNPNWDGPITASGVWGETFTDTNGNGRWDTGEPFVDDPVNTALDSRSADKYDGIFLAGFGNDRIATGCHDDIWARVLVLQGPTRKVALVSVDFVGVINHGLYSGFAHARAMVDPNLGLDEIIFSSTHSHEAPDTLGLWGVEEVLDGKFPHYLQFVDKEIARAINMAAAPEALHPVRVVAGQTDPEQSPDLRGLQIRTRCRPPWVFDSELRALQFVDDQGATVATLINWSTHPESLEDENTLVSSDFPHFIRARVERDLGGTAVYFTGDLGAVEIVGDTCVGGADPHSDAGGNEFDGRDNLGFERTEQIGELVGGAAVAALRSGEPLDIADLTVARQDYHISGTNLAFALGAAVGVLDTDPQAFDVANCPEGSMFCAPVEQYLVRLIGPAAQPLVELVTAPGEIFPELVYGTEAFHRTDCPAANTGLPYEPSIRAAMRARYRLVLGLSPDEFGYIVPGYDFYPAPDIFAEADDPCQGQNFDPQVPRRMVPSHYHEGLSLGADMAATATCHAVRLLGEEDSVQANAACQRVLRTP